MILPNEIILEIFSHMNMKDIYKMGTVCHSWKHQRDHAIALNLQQDHPKILICTSPKLIKNNTMDLTFTSLDENGWFDFVPTTTTTATTKSSVLAKDIQGVRMVFEGWPQDSPSTSLPLSPLQQAHYAFHHTFIPMHQQLYLLPATDPKYSRYWIGDASIGAFILIDNRHVVMAKVSIPWLLLFSRSSSSLSSSSSSSDVYSSSPVPIDSIPILRMDTTTIHDQEDSPALTRWCGLQEALRARSIDPAVTWKYHLAKLYLVGNASLDLDQVVTKIALNEKEWELEKPKLMKATQSHTLQDRIARLFQKI